MENILELAQIKFEYKLNPNLLAKVILNFNNEFEVRFFRISFHPNKALWFQPPALPQFGYAKCFAVLDKDTWKKFEKKVLELFIKDFEEKLNNGSLDGYFLEQIREGKEVEIDIDEIDKSISNIN